jgi:ATP-binding cassette, subfamily B, multidrug efflux pump
MHREKTNKRFTLFTDFLSKSKWKYIQGFLLLILINLLQLATPKITGNIINGVKTKAMNGNELLFWSVIILLISIMVFVLNFLSRLIIMATSNIFDYIARNKMFLHLLDLSISFFNKNSVGDLMALSSNDLGAIRMATGRGMILIANTIVLAISSIIIMSLTMNLSMTIVLAIPFPFLIFTMLKFGKIINKRFRKVQESFADLTRKAQENISGIRIIKAFTREQSEVSSFGELNLHNYEVNMKLVQVQGIFQPLVGLISNISYFIILIYGGILVVKKTITLGDYIAFSSYLGILLRPIGMIGMLISFVERGKASLDRMGELFDTKSEIIDESNVVMEQKAPTGRVEFRNLTFRYSPKLDPVLKNINFTIEPGKTIDRKSVV